MGKSYCVGGDSHASMEKANAERAAQGMSDAAERAASESPLGTRRGAGRAGPGRLSPV